MGGLVENKR